MKNQSGLFTRWYQELAGFNFTVIHTKGKENSNADALRRSSHMAEAPPLAEDNYVEFYEIDKPLINFGGGVNEIQHIQQSLIEIAEEQAKDEVWSKVISWVGKEQLPEKAQVKVREDLVAWSIFDPAVFKMIDGVSMFTNAATGTKLEK